MAPNRLESRVHQEITKTYASPNRPTQVYSPYDISDLTKRCNYTLSSQLAMADCVAQNGTLHGLRDDLAVLFADLDKVIAALEDRHQGG